MTSPSGAQESDHPAPLRPAERRLLRSARRRRDRSATGRILVEGVRAVEELLAVGLPLEIVLVASSLEDTSRGRALLAALQRAEAPLRWVVESELRRWADTDTPQGVLVVAQRPRWSWEDLLGDDGVVLVLDAVQDPGNVGTLVRSAEALGARGVLALRGTADPWGPKAVRAAAGAAFRLPLVEAEAAEAVAQLRAAGYELWAAAVGAPPPPPRRPPRIALAIGNEGAGLSAVVEEAAARRVGIPLRGPTESLNAAVAGSILLYAMLGTGGSA